VFNTIADTKQFSFLVIAKHLRFGHQEDAHEFLRYVIDGMQKSCLAADGYTEK